MSFEIDIRAVGQETTSGDAIAIRYGIFGHPDTQRVIVVDGGFQDNGDDLVSVITTVYGTTRVDLMISTHPHDDHVKGLHRVFEELDVRALWMHRPWHHADSVRAYVEEGRITTQSFNRRLKESLDSAYELEQLAIANELAESQRIRKLRLRHLVRRICAERITGMGHFERRGSEFVRERMSRSEEFKK